MKAPWRCLPMAALLAFPLFAAVAASCGGEGDEAGSCLGCHSSIRAGWAEPSSHRFIYDCRMCHPEKAAEPGPGHRDKVDCLECHSEEAHPASTGPGPAYALCDVCHDPHGTANLKLIRPEIALPSGESSLVAFTSLAGYGAGSFAEPGQGGEPGRGAGTGLCEICHTRTTTYRRDGTGDAHDGGPCPDCHSHALGFAAP